MSIFKNKTIKYKLITITMLTCFAALILAGTGYIFFEWANLRYSLVQSLTSQTEMIAENCKAALAFEDADDANRILQVLSVESSIINGCVYTGEGDLFASYYHVNANKNIEIPKFGKNGYEFREGYLIVRKIIEFEGEILGFVCLQSDLQQMRAMLRRNIIIILGVLIVASLTAYLVSSRLQKIISGPILDLAVIARNVSEKKDYSTRAVITTNDEIGMLIKTFNEMLEQIQRRDSALVKARDDLEERVEMRTADLTAANEQLKNEVNVRQRIEAKQAELLETIEKTNEELKDFAYIVSHDLKAPLRGISTITEWILEDYSDKLDDEGKEQLNLLSNRVNRMYNLIEGILQYSRVGRVQEECAQVDLKELMPEVIDMLSPPENIEVIIEDELPWIECERTRIMQVFQNLMSNAIKYNDKPEGIIKIGCIRREDFWEFSIADNGPGIEDKYFEKIFQLFQTLTSRDSFESTGVGLSVTKKIVELYGGRIWVESEIGKGTTFFFSLPVCKQEKEIVKCEV